VRDGRHIHQFNPAQAAKFNISHTIHSLSFGTRYDYMPANPLDNGWLVCAVIAVVECNVYD
jgi:hypothetical protein